MKIEGKEQDVLLFYVSDIFCMLPIRFVSFIEKPQKNVKVIPTMPVYVCGVCNLERNYITLVDLGKFLKINGLKDKETTGKEMIIVLKENIGLLTGEVMGVEKFEHFKKSVQDTFCSKTIDEVYTIDETVRERYHIKDKDSIVLGLDMPEMINLLRGINNSIAFESNLGETL